MTTTPEMSAPILNEEPTRICAGDSVVFYRNLPDYKTSDGWALRYYLFGFQLPRVVAESAISGDGHTVTFTQEQTASLAPGDYTCVGFAVNTGQRIEIYRGKCEVLPNPELLTESDDTRSQARRTLDNITAVIEGRANSTILNSTVEGTRLDRIPYDQLSELRKEYEVKVRNEEIEELQRQGKPTGRTVYAQFSRLSSYTTNWPT